MKGGNKPGEKERTRSLRAWKKWAYKEIQLPIQDYEASAKGKT